MRDIVNRVRRCLSLLVGAFVISTCSQASAGYAVYAEEYIGLKYSDVVAQGVVTRLDTIVLSVSEFMSKPPWGDDFPIRVPCVSIQVETALRGDLAGKFTFRVPPTSAYETNYEVGQRIIVGCNIDADGEYRLWSDSGRFIWDNGAWICQSAPVGKDRVDERALLAIVKEATLIAVTEAATLIIEGEIVSVAQEQRRSVSGGLASCEVATVVPRHVLKGKASNVVRVLFATDGRDILDCSRYVVGGPERGQVWTMFLTANGDDYCPFAGSNGMFRHSGESLEFVGRRAHDLSRTQMNNFVVREVRDREEQ